MFSLKGGRLPTVSVRVERKSYFCDRENKIDEPVGRAVHREILKCRGNLVMPNNLFRQSSKNMDVDDNVLCRPMKK